MVRVRVRVRVMVRVRVWVRHLEKFFYDEESEEDLENDLF